MSRSSKRSSAPETTLHIHIHTSIPQASFFAPRMPTPIVHTRKVQNGAQISLSRLEGKTKKTLTS